MDARLSTQVRFPSVEVYREALVIDAYVEWTSVAASPEDVLLQFRGELSANARAFETSVDGETGGITSRPRTASVVLESPVPYAAGETVRSPSLSAIVQEIVDQADWDVGNALVVVVDKIEGAGARDVQSWSTLCKDRREWVYCAGAGSPRLVAEYVRTETFKNRVDDAEDDVVELARSGVAYSRSTLGVGTSGSTAPVATGLRFDDIPLFDGHLPIFARGEGRDRATLL